MFFNQLAFEWRYFSRQPSFYITALIFFGLPFLAATINGISMGGASLLKNAPFAITNISLFFNFLGMFMVVNFAADAATRDTASGMHQLVDSQPNASYGYHLGRLCGALLIVWFIVALVPLGLCIGAAMPWVASERLGEFHASYYLATFGYFSAPTMLVLTLLFYLVAKRFQSTRAAYLAAVAALIGFEVADAVGEAVERGDFAAMFDPFAMQAFEQLTRYWSIAEKNHHAIELSGSLLYNRLLWLSFAGGLLLWITQLSSGRAGQTVSQRAPRRWLKRRNGSPSLIPSKQSSQSSFASQLSQPSLSELKSAAIVPPSGWRQWITQLTCELRLTIKTPRFVILLLLMAIILLTILQLPYHNGATPILPMTQYMVEGIHQALKFFLPLVIIFYSGEIVWREREYRFDQLLGCLPVKSGIFWAAKLTTLCLLVCLILLSACLLAIAYQQSMDINQIDATQYFVSLFFFEALPTFMLCVAALFFQIVSRNKYMGMLLTALFFFLGYGLDAIGFESNLYHFARSPGLIHSDMNGYGWSLKSHSWFMLYWGAASLMIAIASFALWQPRSGESLITRLKSFYLDNRHTRTAFLLALLIFTTSGGYIVYNNRVLNIYTSQSQREQLLAEYETNYVEFRNAPVPSVTQVNAHVDIFPAQRQIKASAAIVVENKSGKAIERFLVTLPEYSPLSQVKIDGGYLSPQAGALDTHWFVFEQPLQPGEKRSGEFIVERKHQGFIDGEEDIALVANGTSIDNSELFPIFGYFPQQQLLEPSTREKYGLPRVQRENPLEAKVFYSQPWLGNGYGHIQFDAVISTSEEQTAFAPGRLVKEWSENQRHYFHYRADQPILNFYAFTSARLQRFVENYHGVDIEIYHHPGHAMNVVSMLDAVKDSLDFFADNFTPYQYRQLKILEIPGYRKYAQSFANTIPFPEYGFVMDIRDPANLNNTYKVTAHEVAHQWWGHQIQAANVQGKHVIVETLAEYCSLMVVAKKFGEPAMRDFMKHELDDYLKGRTREKVAELPLMRAEGQGYLHYNKGALVMVALRDLLGEEKINLALKTLLETYRFRNDQYPTTLDLMQELHKVANDNQQAQITSLFSDIALYDLKAKQASSKPLADGRYRIEIEVESHKFLADGDGNETESPLDQWIEIGLLHHDPGESDDADNLYQVQKYHLTSGESHITVEANEIPAFAIIDPLFKNIDRDLRDNVVQLQQ